MTAARARLRSLFHDEMAELLYNIRCQRHQRSCLCQLTPGLPACAEQQPPCVLV